MRCCFMLGSLAPKRKGEKKPTKKREKRMLAVFVSRRGAAEGALERSDSTQSGRFPRRSHVHIYPTTATRKHRQIRPTGTTSHRGFNREKLQAVLT